MWDLNELYCRRNQQMDAYPMQQIEWAVELFKNDTDASNLVALNLLGNAFHYTWLTLDVEWYDIGDKPSQKMKLAL